MTEEESTEESSKESENVEMLFYCRDCQSVIIDPKKRGHKYIYQCPICKKDRVAFGTKSAICDFFNIKEVMLQRMLDNQNQK